jgi:hypothetical protein
MFNKISRLRGRSMAELGFRVSQARGIIGERLRLRFRLGRDYEAGETSAAVLLRGIDEVLSILSGGFQAPRAIMARFAQLDRKAADELSGQALLLRRGAVNLLGLPSVFIGATPDWHRDAVSGFVAPRRHWSRIPYLNAALVGDHKSLWEVNRHQYLYAPAICWLLDSDAEDFYLVQRHLNSWLQENPPALGVNWASSLEVAYRAMTWCWLLWLLKDAPWDETVLKRVRAKSVDLLQSQYAPHGRGARSVFSGHGDSGVQACRALADQGSGHTRGVVGASRSS